MATENSYPVHDCSTHCFGLFHNGDFIRTGKLDELKAEGIRMTSKDGLYSTLATLKFDKEPDSQVKLGIPILVIHKFGKTIYVNCVLQ